MQEILNMIYWDFVDLQEVMRDNAKRASGKPVTKSELKPSQKKMIERLKEMKK